MRAPTAGGRARVLATRARAWVLLLAAVFARVGASAADPAAVPRRPGGGRVGRAAAAAGVRLVRARRRVLGLPLLLERITTPRDSLDVVTAS
ncbi:hypothetical protein [Streptomyces caniscabiei]|uniref:hypothetical protein n=1 Tax=Streptomyces caniscabiei TaxID=2746961 RepID=UPI00211AFD9F|nr:hypothetical protein [Streptomyces caniscabiei]